MESSKVGCHGDFDCADDGNRGGNDCSDDVDDADETDALELFLGTFKKNITNISVLLLYQLSHTPIVKLSY